MHKRIETTSLDRTTARHLANELFRAIKENEWKKYYRDHVTTPSIKTTARATIPRGTKGEVEPRLEVTGEWIATTTLPDTRLKIIHSFALFLAKPAFIYALDDLRRQELSQPLLEALSGVEGRLFHVMGDSYRRNPRVGERAGLAGEQLLGYCEVHRLSLDATADYLESLPEVPTRAIDLKVLEAV